jgi:large subunit ribosomal protein L9
VKIILVESVNHLGRSGELVAVKPGYARNYLIPRQLAMVANKANMAILESQQAVIQEKESKKRALALELQKQLEALTLEVKVETNEEEQLFGTLGVNDIAKLCESQGHIINKRDIVLPQGQITALGNHPFEVVCHIDVIAKLTLSVIK